MAMNSELKAKWTAALRSGAYRQCRGALRIDYRDEGPGHCCLGVLFEISQVGFWSIESCEYSANYGNRKYQGFLPFRNTGLPHPQQRDLSSMTDRGLSFGEIEDWID